VVVHELGSWEVMGSNLGSKEMDSIYIFVEGIEEDTFRGGALDNKHQSLIKLQLERGSEVRGAVHVLLIMFLTCF